MVESDIRPTGIQVIDIYSTPLDEYLYVDTVVGGRVRIYGRYNINEVTRTTFGDVTYIAYSYDEGVLYWNPPATYVVNNVVIVVDIDSRESVESYVAANAFEIMGYIKQIKVSW